MRTRTFWIIGGFIFFFACKDTPPSSVNETVLTIKDELIQIERQLKQQQNVRKDKALANRFIELAKTFAKEEPQDSLTPHYVYHAAEIARALGNYAEAIALLDKACTRYRNFSKRPDALFLQGFTYDQDLNDKTSAKKYYRKFLDQFPDHPFAKDVELLMKYIQQDKSVEELVEEFKKESPS